MNSIDDAIKRFKKDFEQFVHKGEDCDDPKNEWVWTIRGSFPAEVELVLEAFIRQTLTDFAQEVEEKVVNISIKSITGIPEVGAVIKAEDYFDLKEKQRQALHHLIGEEKKNV